MILSGQTIRSLNILSPFAERTVFDGMSYGVSYCGYDIRVAQEFILHPTAFTIASSVEEFNMPRHVAGVVHDKSTWARKGLSVFNTVLEPGWKGFLTLELVNNGSSPLEFKKGHPIAQVIFHMVDQEPETTYQGKYQNQEAGPQGARYE